MLRWSLALLPFTPTLFQRLSSMRPQDDAALLPGLEIGAWCAFGYITQAIGLAQTTPSKGAFICALFMVICPLANGLMGKRVAPQTWFAVSIALLGTACLEGVMPGLHTLIGASSPAVAEATSTVGNGMAAAGGINPGDRWCFGGALGFGAMFARMEAHVERIGSGAALALTVYQLVALFVATVAWSAVEGFGANGGPVSPSAWLEGVLAANAAEPMLLPSIAFMGLVSGALVLWGETIVLEMVPSTEAGVIFATEPVWATGIAAVLLNQAITPNEILGGGAIFVACLALQLDLDKMLGMSPDESAAHEEHQ